MISDGLNAFDGIDEAGFEHETIVTGGGAASMEILALHWVNIILGNLKNYMHGTYHALKGKDLPRYLVEFNYLFNRRFKLDQLVDRLLTDAVRTPPIPERLVKWAKVAWLSRIIIHHAEFPWIANATGDIAISISPYLLKSIETILEKGRWLTYLSAPI